MKGRAVWLFLLGVAFAGFAAAQTKFSGELKCGKPSKEEKIDVADHEGHALTLTENKCTWPKPVKLGDGDTREGTSVATGEVKGSTSTEKGYHWGTTSTGDKWYVTYQGTAVLKDGKPQSVSGTYKFMGGTGKLKNLKGGGSYRGKPNDDGSITFAVTGSYSLPKS